MSLRHKIGRVYWASTLRKGLTHNLQGKWLVVTQNRFSNRSKNLTEWELKSREGTPGSLTNATIAEQTNDEASKLASYKSEMPPLWPLELSGMSRGIIFHLGVLQVPSKSN
jgi:hypothetical protein